MKFDNASEQLHCLNLQPIFKFATNLSVTEDEPFILPSFGVTNNQN